MSFSYDEHEERRRPTRAAADRGRAATGRTQRPTRTRPCGEQLALVDEVRGEERDEQHLRDLARLEVQRADARPRAAPPLIVRPMHGRERQQQRTTMPSSSERVAVALEDADVAHDDQRERRTRAIADRDPHRLHARCA